MQGVLSCGTGPEEACPKSRAQCSVSPQGSPPYCSCLPVPSGSWAPEALQVLVPAVLAGKGMPVPMGVGVGSIPAACSWAQSIASTQQALPAHFSLTKSFQSPLSVSFGLFLPLPAQVDGSCAAAADLFPAALVSCPLVQGISTVSALPPTLLQGQMVNPYFWKYFASSFCV